MISQTDILEEIKETSDEYQHVILGTYSFDPDFFEEKILPVFRTKDAETILVLTDKNEYQNRFSDMSRAGQEYYIDYCYAAQTFHPKFILLTWSEGIKLFLGSNNLTKQAWFESGEMVSSITYYFSEKDKYKEKILSDFKGFLSKILEKNYLKSQKHGKKIQEVLEKIPEFKDGLDSKVKLLSNIDEPILNQVNQIINEPIKSVTISAPFFNTEGSVLDFFIKNGCKNFDIFIQPNKVTEFPKEKIKKLKSKDVLINTNQIKFKENENRFIHAKILIIKTDSGSYCLFGSANPTYSGMLTTPEKGNLELCVLSKNSDQNYYAKLIENDSMTVEPIKIDDIVETTHDNKKSEKIIQDNLLDSYLEGKSLILLRDGTVSPFDVILSHSDEEFLKIPIQSDKQELSINLNETQFTFCSRPTYVFTEFTEDGNLIQSNKRWISTQTLELTPRKMDIERIQKTDGRYGLISFLNKLEQYADDSEWFYYLLQRVKFDKLSTLEPVRRRIIQRKFEDEEDSEYEVTPKTDIVSNFKSKFQKNNKNIKETFESEEIPIEKFDKLFNQFLAWSKVVTWFVLRNKEFIDNLRFIRANMEEFLKIVQKLNNDDKFKEHLEKIHFWHHLLFFCYLIFRFQKKAGFIQNNKGVVKVFSDTTLDIIQSFQLEHKQINFSEMSLALKEYDEFENLEINFSEMERIFQEEFKAEILKNT